MRTIKFRAYIKELGEIYDVLSIFKKFPHEDFYRAYINKDIKDGEVSNYRMDGKENILMQYTGLKDKNGDEIYEGDIIKAYHAEYGQYEIESVCFRDGVFSLGRYWKDGIHDWYSMEQYESFELEIIGNIYENPELLTNK